MKILIQSLFIFFINYTSSGQVLINGSDSGNIYSSVSNKIELFGFKDCSDLIVKIDGFDKDFQPIDCRFNLLYLVRDTAKLNVIQKGKVVFQKMLFEADVLGHAYLSVNDELINDNYISKEQFYKMEGIEIHYNCPWLKTKVISYVFVVEDEILGSKAFENHGGKLNRKVLEQLLTFKKPVRIYIEDINYIAQFENDLIDPIKLTVK